MIEITHKHTGEVYEFPDNTPDEEIERAIKQYDVEAGGTRPTLMDIPKAAAYGAIEPFTAPFTKGMPARPISRDEEQEVVPGFEGVDPTMVPTGEAAMREVGLVGGAAFPVFTAVGGGVSHGLDALYSYLGVPKKFGGTSPQEFGGTTEEELEPFEQAPDYVRGLATEVPAFIAGAKAEHVGRKGLNALSELLAKRGGSTLGPRAVPGARPEVRTEVPAPETPTSNLSYFEQQVLGKKPRYEEPLLLEGVEPVDELTLRGIHTPEHIQTTIDDLAFREMRRGRIKHEETIRLADELGMTPEEVLARPAGKAYNAEQIHASRRLLKGAGQEVLALVEASKKGPVDLIQFRQAVERFQGIRAQFKEASKEAGRALEAHKIPLAEQEKITRGTMEYLGRLDPNDPGLLEKAGKFLEESQKVSLADKLFEAWVNALLSGPKTHLVNTFSNTLTTLMRPWETLNRASLDAMRSAFTGAPREVLFKEAQADLLGMWAGLGDAWKHAKQVTLGAEPWFGAGKMGTKLEGAYSPAIGGTLGKVVRSPGRFLVAADEFFKFINYAGFKYSRAFRGAVKKGFKGRAAMKEAVKLFDDPALTKLARNEAAYRTFTNELGEVGKYLQSSRDKVPGVRYIIPFFRTPTNILKFGLERTPGLGMVVGPGRSALRAGGEVAREAMAKQMSGLTAVLGAGLITHVLGGQITGGGPNDANERRALRATGWQPYSIRVGGRYYSYNRLEPAGIVLGMAADFVDLFDGIDQEDAAEKIQVMIKENLLNKSFMQGMTNFIHAMSEPGRFGERWLQRMVGTLIPTGINQLTQVIDPTLRLPQSKGMAGIGEALTGRIPGASGYTLPFRDIWGRPIIRDDSLTARLFYPGVTKEELNDPVSKEIRRLVQEAGLGIGTPGKVVANERLTPQQFDRYYERSGQLARMMVERYVYSSLYRAHSDKRKVKEIQARFNKARSQARKELASRDREFPRSKRSGGRPLSKIVKSPRRRAIIRRRLEEKRSRENPFSQSLR